VNARDAFLFVEMHQDLGVALGAKTMARANQGRAQFAIVVDLAVEDHPNGPVFVRDGLAAGGEIDDAEAAHA